MIFRLFLLASLCVCALYAGIAEFEAFVKDEVSSKTPPSAAVAVLHGNEIIYEKAFGFDDAQQERPSSVHSVYHLFSLSKIITATVMLQLVEEGRIALDAKLSTYFPRFKARYEGKDVDVTLQQLLSHSSGITDSGGNISYMFNDARYEQMLSYQESLPEFVELDYAPGSEAKYSNAEYIIAGYLIEKLTGNAFEEAVYRRVLRPAGMETTGFEYDEAMASREVFGTLRMFSGVDLAMRMMLSEETKSHYEGTMLWLNRFHIPWAPAGGLVGSLHDMALFMKAYHSLTLFGLPAYEAFMQGPLARVDSIFSPYDSTHFGLGWYHIENEGEVFYQHQGVGPGYRTIIRMYPANELSLVILTSQTGTDIDSWADSLFEHFSKELL